MRQIHGLEKLVEQQPGRLNAQKLTELLLTDLRDCRCSIYGTIGDDDKVLLAELALLPDSLAYEMFDQRIDLIVAGPILRNDCVPLTYRLQGEQFALSGRCSMIPGSVVWIYICSAVIPGWSATSPARNSPFPSSRCCKCCSALVLTLINPALRRIWGTMRFRSRASARAIG